MSDARGAQGPGPRPRGRPPKAEDGLARERILEAATELFGERGFSGTSVSDICARANVGKPAVYWHFENKEGLLDAVLEGVSRNWVEQVDKQAAQATVPADRLRRFLQAWREMVLERPHYLRLPLLIELERHETGEGSARRILPELWRVAEERIVENIREVVPLPLRDLEFVGHTAVTLLQGAMLRQVIEPDEPRLDRLLDELRRTISLLVWARLPAELRKNTVEHLEVLKELDAAFAVSEEEEAPER